MCDTKNSIRTFLVGILLILTSVGLLLAKGCQESAPVRPAAPTVASSRDVSLQIARPYDAQAKANGLTITVVSQETGSTVFAYTAPAPVTFPVTTQLDLLVPPCLYTVSATAVMSLGGTRSASTQINACQFDGSVALTISTYEGFLVIGNPIQAPAQANAGETILVNCVGSGLNAPDIDQHPITATLSEESAGSVSGSLDPASVVGGTFPDPYPLTSPQEQRTFICEMTDGRTTQRFEASVTRMIATPTPTPTGSPTPTPTATPTVLPSCATLGWSDEKCADGSAGPGNLWYNDCHSGTCTGWVIASQSNPPFSLFPSPPLVAVWMPGGLTTPFCRDTPWQMQEIILGNNGITYIPDGVGTQAYHCIYVTPP